MKLPKPHSSSRRSEHCAPRSRLCRQGSRYKDKTRDVTAAPAAPHPPPALAHSAAPAGGGRGSPVGLAPSLPPEKCSMQMEKGRKAVRGNGTS